MKKYLSILQAAIHQFQNFKMTSLLKPASKTEKFFGNPLIEAGATTLAAFGTASGVPFAEFLPILSNSIVAELQRKRIEEAFLDISNRLKNYENALKAITEPQYKLILESILALHHTISEEKITYLKNAICNVIELKDIEAQEVVMLSRILRDISAEEANFLCTNFIYKQILLSNTSEELSTDVLTIKPETPESLVVTGLVSLGILESAGAAWKDSSKLRYSTITAKLIALLKN